jgi:septum formation protein
MVEPHPLPLVLASGSPRRRQLLASAGVDFEMRPAEIDEGVSRGEAPAAYAARLAETKARTVARAVGVAPPRVVLGADTVVVLGDRIFGKPRDDAHAVELLEHLLGHTHRVITAVAVTRSDGCEVRRACVESRVSMRAADRDEIERYVATGESLDKAGAYAVQGEGRRFIERVEGSESNVIGLPLDETLDLLRALGIGAATG